jgi:hypothetical protein
VENASLSPEPPAISTGAGSIDPLRRKRFAMRIRVFHRPCYDGVDFFVWIKSLIEQEKDGGKLIRDRPAGHPPVALWPGL